MSRALVSLSGGIDSTTILGFAVTRCSKVEAVSFRYPSKHNLLELEAAHKISAYYKVPHREINVWDIFKDLKSNLLKGGDKIPEGHYEEETMKLTVVPCRNIVFCSILAAIAESEGFDSIYMGVHAGDRMCYPDCRSEFVDAMSKALHHGTFSHPKLKTPFVNWHKSEVVAEGYSQTIPIPYHLSRTCYTSNDMACGRCGSCQERLASFAACGVNDPIEYASREILPKS